jgi:hypothetical protein
VNRRNLKIINYKHELPTGLGLEMSNNEIVVWKRVLLAMSCSINAELWELTQKDCKQENLERGERKNQIIR